MKKTANIVAILLGVAFIIFGLSFFVPAIKSVLPAPSAPNGEDAIKWTTAYFTAMVGSGFLGIIKALEIVAGLLLIIKCTRGWGVVLSGALLFNIFFVLKINFKVNRFIYFLHSSFELFIGLCLAYWPHLYLKYS
jgi:hypothetical protein